MQHWCYNADSQRHDTEPSNPCICRFTHCPHLWFPEGAKRVKRLKNKTKQIKILASISYIPVLQVNQIFVNGLHSSFKLSQLEFNTLQQVESQVKFLELLEQWKYQLNRTRKQHHIWSFPRVNIWAGVSITPCQTYINVKNTCKCFLCTEPCQTNTEWQENAGKDLCFMWSNNIY